MLGTIVLTALATLALVVVYRLLSHEAPLAEGRIEPLYAVTDERFLRFLRHALQAPWEEGNRIEHLENGDRIFPALMAAIGEAERSITLETFVWWESDVGRRLAAALAGRAASGVAVHVLLDWAGSEAPGDLLESMRRAGAEVEIYNPLSWYQLQRLNRRTHRKILVVDGRVGFTGGVGIADEWRGDARNPSEWRDSHFRVEGPVVAQLQAAFLDNWLTTCGRVPHSEAYFPELRPVGDVPAQVLISSPRGGSTKVRLMYLAAIAAARRRILVGNSYFLPGEAACEALLAARSRGVEVRVVLPGPEIDWNVARAASRASWGALLEAGVEIYEYLPTMYHAKLFAVDDRFVSIGSTNFDPRSFHLNLEVNLNALHNGLAGVITDVLDRDVSRSRRITLEAWRRRPLRQRAWEEVASAVRNQL